MWSAPGAWPPTACAPSPDSRGAASPPLRRGIAATGGTAGAGSTTSPCQGDWRELAASDEVDAVVVCTSNDSHGAIALAALEAGKPVFTEYPLARSLEEAERVVRTAREKEPRRPRRPRRGGIGRAAVAAPAGGLPGPVATGGVRPGDPGPRGASGSAVQPAGIRAPDAVLHLPRVPPRRPLRARGLGAGARGVRRPRPRLRAATGPSSTP